LGLNVESMLQHPHSVYHENRIIFGLSLTSYHRHTFNFWW